MMVMENHGCEPVVLEEGYVLGELQDVKCNEASDSEGRQGVVSAVIMGDDFGEERLQRLKQEVKFDQSNLDDGEADQLNDLLVEYADVFALDSSELEMTDLVTHAIDTGDSVPIKQAARRIPFALRKTVDDMVQKLVLAREQYVLIEGVLHYMSKDKTLRLIPPEEDRHQLFDEVHGGMFGGHLREAKIFGELAKRYWWPHMRSQVARWCQACVICASRQVGKALQPPLTPIPVAGPFDWVGVDVLKFPKSELGNQYAIVFVDYLTKWPEVYPASDQSALTIANLFMREVVCRHGVPAQLLSDRGKAFLSLLLREVCEVLWVKKLNTTAYHPQTDGLVERFNRTLTNMLAKRVERNGSDWDIQLPYVLFAYRSCIQESTQESPFLFVHGRDPRLPSVLDLEIPIKRFELSLDTYKGELVSELMEAWDSAQKNVQKAQKAQKRAYDRKSKETGFEIGERVFVYMPKEKLTKAYKFARPFHGPYRVVEVLDTGVSVRPVHRPQEESFRVALNRLRRCPAAATEEFWPPRRQKKTPQKDASEKSEDVGGNWRGRLRDRQPKSCEDTLHKSGDM